MDDTGSTADRPVFVNVAECGDKRKSSGSPVPDSCEPAHKAAAIQSGQTAGAVLLRGLPAGPTSASQRQLLGGSFGTSLVFSQTDR